MRFHVLFRFPPTDDIQGVTSACICQCHHFGRKEVLVVLITRIKGACHISFYQRCLSRNIETNVGRRRIMIIRFPYSKSPSIDQILKGALL